MKKMLLALAVLGTAAWQSANAIVLKANDNEFANVGLELQIWDQIDGKTYHGDQTSDNFSVNNARVYFSGEVNPMVQFGADLDFDVTNANYPDGTARSHQGTNNTRVSTAFINFKFMPEMQLMAGLFRDPVSRLSNTDRYTDIIPTGFGYGINDTVGYGVYSDLHPFYQIGLLTQQQLKGYTIALTNLLNPFTPISIGDVINNTNKDAGIAIWGNVADTMLKYYLFAGNGAYDYQGGINSKGNLKYGLRVEFTPTMLGYKNSSGFSDQDTFLGALNNLTIGLGYEQQKLDCSNPNGTAGALICGDNTGSLTPEYYDVDANWQQKFGDFVPEIQLGWAEKKDLGRAQYLYINTRTSPTTYDYYYTSNNMKSEGYYVQLATLYDRVVGLGKPEIAFRWEQSTIKNFIYTSGTSLSRTSIPGVYVGTLTGEKDAKVDRYSIFVNYYIAGEAAKMSLGADIVNPNNTLKQVYGGKSFTDWTLALQTEF